MRESDQQDGRVASLQGRESQKSGPSATAVSFETDDETLPHIDIDVGAEQSFGTGYDDEEGETLVDALKSAVALQHLRSLGTPSPRATSRVPASEQTNSLASLRVSNASAGNTDGPAPLAGIAARYTSHGPPPRKTNGIPSGYPGAATPRPVGQSVAVFPQDRPNPIEHRPSPIEASTTDALYGDVSPRGLVGRRSGILIAAGTAAAVIVAVSIWTSPTEQLTDSSVLKAAGPVVALPRAPGIAALPTKASEVPPAELPMAAASAPAAELTPTAEIVTAAETVPAAEGNLPVSDTALLAPTASPDARRKHASAWVDKSRGVRKAVIKNAHRRKAHGTKISAPRIRSRTAAAPSPDPSVDRASAPPHIGADPDATLPITD